MDATAHSPVPGISPREAAEIIGCTRAAVYQLIYKVEPPKTVKHPRGGIDRAAVEQLAVQRWTPDHPYWASNTEAARPDLEHLPAAGRPTRTRRPPALPRDHRWAPAVVPPPAVGRRGVRLADTGLGACGRRPRGQDMSGWQRWAVTGVDRSASRYGIHFLAACGVNVSPAPLHPDRRGNCRPLRRLDLAEIPTVRPLITAMA
jgi:hypothetical protein